MVHVFGSGHSRIMVEEMWPRYGSFPGFNPIVELSLSFHNLVVGANGQRQAMFLENVPGLAERILRTFALETEDSAFVISSSGCNLVPIEMAEGFQKRGIKVVVIISREHSEASNSKHPTGKKLQDFADLVLDTGAPVGDAMVTIPGLDTPVSPGSTIGGCLLVNGIKAEVARAWWRPDNRPRCSPPRRSSEPSEPPRCLRARMTNTLTGSRAYMLRRAPIFYEGKSAAYQRYRQLPVSELAGILLPTPRPIRRNRSRRVTGRCRHRRDP